MNTNAGAYAGLDRFEARKKIVEDLKALGLLEKITEHTAAIGLCERSKTIVEPRVSTQWFCRMKPLAEPAIAAVERGEIQIVPENWREVYFHWMRNIRDWTLSRQLWWGHRIPAWYCRENGHITVAREAPTKCTTCGSTRLEQDPDVLDTWFSSGLWPFSTMGWPENTADYRTYYPTSLLITGYEILFFWVARMAMLGIHFTGKVPFRNVYLHSIVRTSDGQKMSKSKGTGIDPVDVNRKYGTDAMRFTLALMSAPGSDLIWTEDRIQSARNFANKIWNAARFLFVNFDKFQQGGAKLEELAAPEIRAKAPHAFGGKIPLVDAWLFARLAGTTEQINDALTNYRFHESAHSVYEFFWGDFCDWYIEWVKPELQSPDRERATVAWKNLFAAFDAALRLLHPFMPFLTEELWHQLPQNAGEKSIALDVFPESHGSWKNVQALNEVVIIQEVVTAFRNIRAELKLDPKKKVAAEFSTSDAAIGHSIEANRTIMERLALLSELRIVPREQFDSKVGTVRSTAKFDVRVAHSEKMDATAEKARLKKETEGLQKAIASKERQLVDETFRNRAPEKIIKGLEATLAQQRIEIEKLRKRLEDLNQGGQAAGT
jgi:valyl-tRNA synthetase